MSIYKSGVDAYRDTTKWLAAFTPATAIITATTVVGAPVGASLAAAPDPWAWVFRHGWLVWCGMAILAATFLILWFATKVLSAPPVEVADILARTGRAQTRIDTALGDGIIAPDFTSATDFDTAAQQMRGLTGDELVPLRTAFETLREWTLFTETRAWFNRFVLAVGVGVIVMCVAIATALTQIGTAAAITQPTAVTVQLSDAGRAALTTMTGCQGPSTSVFLAVAGTWDAPVLTVTGPGCRFGTRWAPTPGEAMVSPVP